MAPNDDKPLTPAQARQKLQQGLADYLAGNDTGPIVFRLKRTKKANHTYPLKLTQQQRETLLEFTNLNGKLKKKIEQAGEGMQIVPVTWNELHKLNDETGQAAYYARSPHKKRLMAVMGRVVKFFEEEHAEVFAPEKPTTRRTTKTDQLFQFKITLLDIKPAIWRRIQVPDCTLVDLHEYIQAAFGWENYHLHQFDIDGVRFSQPAPDGDEFGMESEDETDVLLSKLLPNSSRKARWIYEYDFGDDWRHEVLFEGFPPADPKAKPPICLEGERACPPEDCGGPPGYCDHLDAIADPRNDQHEEMMKWRGPFDPEAFDVKTDEGDEEGEVTDGDEPMNPKRITIIPFIHGKLTRDGKMSEPDIYWIMEKWLERHPEIKTRTQDIRVSRGTMTLPHGGKTDLIRATIIVGEDIEGYEPAQDLDLYEYFLSDDQGDRELSQSG